MPPPASPREGAGRAGLYATIGVGILALLALLAFGAVRALRPAHVPAPTAFLPYTALDKSFTCDVPPGWSRASGGGDGGNAAGVLVTNGAARLEVDGDLSGSLMGDMATASNNLAENLASMTNQPSPKLTPPVETLHQGSGQGPGEEVRRL